jgi:hypothetical protein
MLGGGRYDLLTMMWYIGTLILLDLCIFFSFYQDGLGGDNKLCWIPSKRLSFEV